MKSETYLSGHSGFSKAYVTGLILTLLFGAILFPAETPVSAKSPLYKDKTVPIDDRVEDLLRRMTLEEKVAQMMSVWMAKPNDNSAVPKDQLPFGGEFSAILAKERMPHGIGHFARQREMRNARRSAEYANAAQKWLIENTRLGIPAIFHDEILHGNMGEGSTVFPVPISLASTWDPELIKRVFTVGALHTRIRGTHHVLGPNLDLARDPRWGRTEETYGEDPYLASRMAVAIVKTLQGGATYDQPQIDDEHVIATGKHYAGHGQPEGGTNIGPVNISERILRETHFATFEAAVREANLFSIMPAYHEVDGIPVHANRWMLEDVLRKEWGFKGVVVSDYYAMTQLGTLHFVAGDKAEAAKQSLEAGLDIELPDPDVNTTLVEQVKAGKIPVKLIDKAVSRILYSKFQVGVFEKPYVDPAKAERLTDTAADRALAAEAARKAIILLKNENNTLPLDRTKIKSIAVIGPNAERAHLGGYTDPAPPRSVSLLEGIKNKVGGSVKVNYAKGVKITKEDGNWFADTSTLNDEADDKRLIAEAVKTAAISDVVVLSIGGNEDTNKEGWADNHLGDRDSLELVGRQNELVKAIQATGKPVVAVLTNSGPLAINYVAENVPAILEGFYLGEEGGTAAADVIFGDYNPGGKLPVSFPKSVGQLPIFYNRKPTSRRGYLFSTTDPLYAFGHGLSYTTFSFSNLELSSGKVTKDGSLTVSVGVKNTGTRAGDEVAQLYIRDEVSSVTRPVKELRDFERVTLDPGETKKVTFRITPDKLSFYNREMKRVVEPGFFKIQVGGNSVDVIEARFEVTD
ncbi:MAG: glycoside hydrolase family 3 C-terminal domain-containing protein [Acidobacteriota bacterium]|nr:glycoside hydrolase family 3 C-terminal domain-containing protein [Acidobacteriota bacterium]MDH3529810.1 glycoside hydrolase family 3 C-terminal domain-containing protein [Acidobacteriota bacterium]